MIRTVGIIAPSQGISTSSSSTMHLHFGAAVHLRIISAFNPQSPPIISEPTNHGIRHCATSPLAHCPRVEVKYIIIHSFIHFPLY